MRVSDYIAKRLKELNNHVFTLVGGGSMYLNDSVARSGIRYVCMHHEQAAAMAAEVYARISDKIGLCVVTTGPGGTNTVTGVYGAWVDSIPILFISGQVRTEVMKTSDIRQIGDQEVNIVDIVRPITKYARTCYKAKDIKSILDVAIHEATTGRPGPVWVDVPLDIQREEITEGSLSNVTFIDPKYNYNVKQVIDKIKEARRPIILAGNGIRLGHAIPEFWNVIKKLHIPVVPDFNARDLGQFEFGAFGMGGKEASNKIINEADLLLILGCRMNIRQIGYNWGEFGRNAYKIMVDIDKAELNKFTFKPDLKIQADIRAFLSQMDMELTEPFLNNWVVEPDQNVNVFVEEEDYVSPSVFTYYLNRCIKPGDIVVCANGLPPSVVCRELQIKEGMRLILNSGCGAMGYGLPAAIGAAFASGKSVICIEGDGSLQLNIQELQTIIYNRLPVKLFYCNNGGYNSIRNTQDAYFNGRYVGADVGSGVGFPEMQSIAMAYGFKYYSIWSDQELDRKIYRIMEDQNPLICELRMDPNYKYKKASITGE